MSIESYFLRKYFSSIPSIRRNGNNATQLDDEWRCEKDEVYTTPATTQPVEVGNSLRLPPFNSILRRV